MLIDVGAAPEDTPHDDAGPPSSPCKTRRSHGFAPVLVRNPTDHRQPPAAWRREARVQSPRPLRVGYPRAMGMVKSLPQYSRVGTKRTSSPSPITKV